MDDMHRGPMWDVREKGGGGEKRERKPESTRERLRMSSGSKQKSQKLQL